MELQVPRFKGTLMEIRKFNVLYSFIFFYLLLTFYLLRVTLLTGTKPVNMTVVPLCTESVFAFFEHWLPKTMITFSQAFPEYAFPRENFVCIRIFLQHNVPILSLKKFVKASNMPLNFTEKMKNVTFLDIF